MFTQEIVAAALGTIGVDIEDEDFEIADVLRGMKVELEHGTRFPDLDVTGDDPVITAKIALAHLREFPDYYDRLDAMEREADAAWSVLRDETPGIV